MKHEIIKYGNIRVLRMLCLDCGMEGFSTRCMQHVLNALADYPNVDEIKLEGVYCREYCGDSLEALKELSKVLHKGKIFLRSSLTVETCRKCESERKRKLERILEKLPEKPSSALIGLKTLLSENRKGSSLKPCGECKDFFVENLKALISIFENCKVVKMGTAILEPRLRPPFSSIRVETKVSPEFHLVQTYEVEDCEIKIFWNQNKLQYLYFVLPTEYRFDATEIEVLSLARKKLAESFPCSPFDVTQMRETVKRKAEEILAEIGNCRDHEKIAACLTRMTAGFGMLDILLADPHVQDIYVDSPTNENPVYLIHSDFGECVTNMYLTHSGVGWLISKFRLLSGRPFSEAFPVLDLDLDGSRCTVVGPPLSPSGVSFAIRRHRPEPWTLPQFVAKGFLSEEAAGLLSLLVDAQTAMLITGHRGAGKTSLLSSLMLEVPPNVRMITIEDTRELPVEKLRRFGFKILPLVIQPVVGGTETELRAEDALKAALRLGESVLIIGEVRGSEAKVLYEAMRVGTAGNAVMGTIHGSSAKDVFDRVVFDLEIPESSFKVTDVIVVVSAVREGGRMTRSRKLTEIVEVEKEETRETCFRRLLSYLPEKGKFQIELHKSELLKKIALRWGISRNRLFEMLNYKTAMQRELVSLASREPQILEAEFVVRANLKWREILEIEKSRPSKIFKRWKDWLEKEVKRRPMK
ncbi:MAG: type II/IV secretion system ATPase subunit [Candidatus Hadarchaeales archaeon]